MARAQRSRNYESLIIRGLESTGQRAASEDMGISEPTLTRLKNEHLEKFCDLLVALELKTVPLNWVCLSPKKHETLLYLAELGQKSLGEEEDIEAMLFPNGAEDMAHG